MYETGYGGWENTDEVLIMKELDFDSQKKHIQKLWEQDPKTYSEWKSWCIHLDQFPLLFGKGDNVHYETCVIFNHNNINIFLEKQGNSFIISPKDFATHVLMQVFDEEAQLVTEELKELL